MKYLENYVSVEGIVILFMRGLLKVLQPLTHMALMRKRCLRAK